jgi:hypothetical protein
VSRKRERASLFSAECEGPDCVGDIQLSVGSSAIDFELDPANPTFHRMVMMGGRGWTIYELPDDPEDLLKLVFDSGDDMESSVCQQIPWAYNTEVSDDSAPTNTSGANHTLWNYDEEIREDLLELNDPNEKGCLDQGDGTPGACPMNQSFDHGSGKSGIQLENIVTGVACGRLVAVTASETTSVAWLYDITNIASPDLVKTFHLSPALETKSPGLAYNEGTIGEVDPESFLFLAKEQAPGGKAAVMFGGAHSGTISYWEFDCVEDERPAQDMDSSSARGILKLAPLSVLVTATSFFFTTL